MDQNLLYHNICSMGFAAKIYGVVVSHPDCLKEYLKVANEQDLSSADTKMIPFNLSNLTYLFYNQEIEGVKEYTEGVLKSYCNYFDN